MMEVGVGRTAHHRNVEWCRAPGEDTKRPSGAYDLVTFGSSFNVVDQALAMKETVRLLKPDGWFSCTWNHRDLNDQLQNEVEQIIGDLVPGYDYGTRRADQAPVLRASGLFHELFYLSACQPRNRRRRLDRSLALPRDAGAAGRRQDGGRRVGNRIAVATETSCEHRRALRDEHMGGAAAVTMSVAFGTKAETLERLAPYLKSARILDQRRTTVHEWWTNPQSFLTEVTAAFGEDAELIVRSSAAAEDRQGASLAGRLRFYRQCLHAGACNSGRQGRVVLRHRWYCE